MNVNSSLVEDIISLDEVKADMTAVLSALKDDFTRSLSIRTSPGIQLFLLLGSRAVGLLSPHVSVCSCYTQHKRRSSGSGSAVDVMHMHAQHA